MSVQASDWTGLYREGWGSRLRPASYAHPAKNSYGLSVRIYEHALEEGWIEPGQIVLDPFAGIGGFALEAMRNGLHFIGSELEQRFVDMGQGCDCTGLSKADWVRYQGRWDRMRYEGGRHWCPECLMKAGAVADVREFKPLPLPGTKWAALAKTHQATLFDAAPTASYVRNSGKIPCTGAHRYHGNIETWGAQGMPGSAVIVRGDSRRLGEVLARARLCLSSPPYANSIHGSDAQDYNNTKLAGAQAEGLTAQRATWGVSRGTGTLSAQGYGETEGNLGNLPDTGFEAALAEQGHTVAPEKPGNTVAGEQAMPAASQDVLTALPEGDHVEACERPVIAISSPPWEASLTSKDEDFLNRKFPNGNQALDAAAGYGSSDGQLGQMPPGSHAEALEAGAVTGRADLCLSSPPWEASTVSEDFEFVSNRPNTSHQAVSATTGYGETEGQLGQETGSTFWAASRAILEQVYQVLAPNAHAIFVCKRFVRNKAIVDFPLQWARLCEAVGFTWIHHHKAWLVEDRGAQHTLEGGLEKREVRRLSFFRRLHTQKYPHLAILWEDVLCFVKE